MPNFIFDGIPGVNITPENAHTVVWERINEANEEWWHSAGQDDAIRKVGTKIADELTEASAAVDAGGDEVEHRVMVAYMTAVNNQNAITAIALTPSYLHCDIH